MKWIAFALSLLITASCSSQVDRAKTMADRVCACADFNCAETEDEKGARELLKHLSKSLSEVEKAAIAAHKDRSMECMERLSGRGRSVGAPKTELQLETVKDTTFGFSIAVIKGSQVLAKDSSSQTFSYPLPDGMMEYGVSIGKASVTSRADAERFVTQLGGTVSETKSLSQGFLVVRTPTGVLQEVFAFSRGKTGSVSAKCSGPSRDLSRLVQMCSSLQAI